MSVVRTVFLSERRCISNLIEMQWNRPLLFDPVVVAESIAQPMNPAKTQWFNCDFSLDFVDRRTAASEHVAAMGPVLPNTLGAEVFLVAEKDTLSPMRLELQGGDAFPMKRYRRYIGAIQGALQEAIWLRDDYPASVSRQAFTELTPMSKAAFVRLLVVGSDATFLYFPNETRPSKRGERFNLTQRDDREIDCYVDGSEIVCFDGWVKVEVTRSEWTLAAVPE